MNPDKLIRSDYRIREVAEMFSLPTHTIRFWESEFEALKPKRTESGARRYTRADIKVIKTIHNLLHVKGMKLEAAKEQMRLAKKPNRKPICQTNEDVLSLLRELKTILADNPKGTTIIKAIEAKIKADIKDLQDTK